MTEAAKEITIGLGVILFGFGMVASAFDKPTNCIDGFLRPFFFLPFIFLGIGVIGVGYGRIEAVFTTTELPHVASFASDELAFHERHLKAVAQLRYAIKRSKRGHLMLVTVRQAPLH
ncbi:MAG: hypothetical protein F6K00_30005 [Leptolyngbya sp. SIOISBB]|nr:hypothetical protein [Leptolyngbya sp. SIOISBB]